MAGTAEDDYKAALRAERAAWEAAWRSGRPTARVMASLTHARARVDQARTAFLESAPASLDAAGTEPEPAPNIEELRLALKEAIQNQKNAWSTFQRATDAAGRPDRQLYDAWVQAVRSVNSARSALQGATSGRQALT